MKKFKKILPWAIIGVVFVVVLVLIFILNAKKGEGAGSGATTGEIAESLDIDNGDQKIDWSLYPTYDVNLSESYTIHSSGTYNLTGKISDGLIMIDANDKVVKLVLDSVSITNQSGPAIYILDAKDTVIELADNSINTLTGGKNYSNYDEDVDGVVFSKDDLTFQGNGKLVVRANYLDGIVSKDDLKFTGGKYQISSVNDGIRGKDSVYIVSGNFNINSGGDGIKSTNDTEAAKGFIRIEDGDFKITSDEKGIKAINDISIKTGTFVLNTGDDAIHSNDYIGIEGGDYSISADDDGIHADAEIVIDDGKIEIKKSYEGLEAARVTINDGDINLVTRDDGINVAGGNDSSSQNRPGENPFSVNEENILTINNGRVYINSTGDGMDSNGYIYINGGDIAVDGPISNADGALDANGGVIVNGGTLIAVGASGMAEPTSDQSKIYSINAYVESSVAGSVISLLDEEGNEIISHIAAKSFQHVVIAATSLKKGATYTLNVGNNSQNVTLQSIVTIVGNGGGFGPQSGPQNGPQNRGRR